eukprot:1161475-Pelagomonas_calceolata.AAC.3
MQWDVCSRQCAGNKMCSTLKSVVWLLFRAGDPCVRPCCALLGKAARVAWQQCMLLSTLALLPHILPHTMPAITQEATKHLQGSAGTHTCGASIHAAYINTSGSSARAPAHSCCCPPYHKCTARQQAHHEPPSIALAVPAPVEQALKSLAPSPDCA